MTEEAMLVELGKACAYLEKIFCYREIEHSSLWKLGHAVFKVV